jgi:hypothetical protein
MILGHRMGRDMVDGRIGGSVRTYLCVEEREERRGKGKEIEGNYCSGRFSALRKVPFYSTKVFV